MNRDLYKTLCKPEVLKIAANYVYDDKKDDFIPDVFRNQDYIFNLQEKLERLAQSLKNGTYRPRPLKEIDIPKSGLAVRPGSSGSSVEVLLNFNASSLIRNGLAALKCRQPKETEHDIAISQGEEVVHTMIEMFRAIAAGVGCYSKKVQIALCKEIFQVWKAVGLEGKGLYCNCTG